MGQILTKLKALKDTYAGGSKQTEMSVVMLTPLEVAMLLDEIGHAHCLYNSLKCLFSGELTKVAFDCLVLKMTQEPVEKRINLEGEII